jgi:hypothetical protein
VKRNLQDALATKHDKFLRLGYTLNVTSRAQLTTNATHVMKAGSSATWEGFASLTLALGWRTTASAVTTVDEAGEALTSVNVQRSLPLGPGFGSASTPTPRIRTDCGNLRMQGQARHHRRARRLFSRTTRRSARSTFAGSIVAIGGECCCRGRWTTGLRS